MEEKKKCRIIIAGGRNYRDYETLRKQVRSVFEKYGIDKEEAEIISGHAAGVDRLGERFAEENGILCTIFPANWSKYGRSAGFRRNVAMLNHSAKLVIFSEICKYFFLSKRLLPPYSSLFCLLPNYLRFFLHISPIFCTFAPSLQVQLNKL